MNNRLESYLVWRFCLVGVILTGSAALLVWQLSGNNLWSLLALLSSGVICSLFLSSIYRAIVTAYERTNAQTSAMLTEDYQLRSKPLFDQGCVAEFHQQLNDLCTSLYNQQDNYNQQTYLLYQLISQLGTPIMLFDHKYQLSLANQASDKLLKRPWETLKYASASSLGLEKLEQWQFTENGLNKRWQIRSSSFSDQQIHQELLIFIDIEQPLREQQIESWKQIVKVMTHEIRNSLAPVASLAQTLAERPQDERTLEALNIISERCNSLKRFVESYSKLHQAVDCTPSEIESATFFNNLKALFPQLNISLELNCRHFIADPVLLHQVMINLLKNAAEASATKLVISLTPASSTIELCLSDNGVGMSHPENAFVPLYTTKEHGSGIGLALSKHLIEQHKGTISLTSENESGVMVVIQLPTIPNFEK